MKLTTDSMTPAIPTGYRRLRVGEKRPKGYQYLAGRVWVGGFPWYVGRKLSKQDDAITPYIAPVAPTESQEVEQPTHA